MSTKERCIPSEKLLTWRREFLSRLRGLEPTSPEKPRGVHLSPGNKKTGTTGKFYGSVFVWNLPAVATCPGASGWCLEHCYNADPRTDLFPVDDWAKNWWMVINQPQALYDNIVEQLSGCKEPRAVRLHSSGDFFSPDYVEFWTSVARRAKDTVFWAYTRSWTITEIVPSLQRFVSLGNVELFGSWDPTMAEMPPSSWRRSHVYVDAQEASNHRRNDRRGLICPEQMNLVTSCASCGFCMRPISKDVLFYFH